MEYRREIDGLRALAVIPVILFHAGFSAFRGGFIGVDVFFVISGYLITSIIIEAKRTNSFSIVAFYERRARRILPALFFVAATCLPFAWLWLLPGDLKNFSQSLAAVATFSSNVLFWKESGYFDAAAETKPLLHTWSLAVEEQYYVLFPLFLTWMWRFGGRRVLLSLAFLGTVSLGLAEISVRHFPEAAFFLLPSRGWELLVGAIAAFWGKRGDSSRKDRMINACVSFIGVTFIGISVFLFDKNTPAPGIFSLLPTLGAAAVLVCATRDNGVGKILGHPWFVGIGLISYSAYLWHQPLFAFARYYYDAEPAPFFMASLAVLSLVLAFFSWRFVERPFRDKGRIGRKTVFLFSAMTSVFFFSLGAYGHVTEGFEKYFYAHRLSTSSSESVKLARMHTEYNMYEHMFDDKACKFWGRNMTPEMEMRIADCAARHGKAIFIIGGSHAMNLFNIIAKADVFPFIVGIAQGYCRITDSRKDCQYDGFDAFLKRSAQNVKMVVYHQTGNPFLLDKSGDAQAKNKHKRGNVLTISEENIEKVLAYVEKTNKLVPAIWVGPWTEPQMTKQKAFNKKAKMNPESVANFDRLDRRLKEVSAQRGIRYFSLVDLFSSDGDELWDGKCLKFRDLNHFSRCGEDLIAQRHKAFWEEIAKP